MAIRWRRQFHFDVECLPRAQVDIRVQPGAAAWACAGACERVTLSGMSTLAEIEAAAEALPPEQKQELLLFLAARLRAQGARLPEPRKFSREQMAGWIAEDEADLQRFRKSE